MQRSDYLRHADQVGQFAAKGLNPFGIRTLPAEKNRIHRGAQPGAQRDDRQRHQEKY